ncbi:DUF6973 domain-containing protein [Nocardia sp. 004]|uniref:DUF6973 domain-containing protein n=1 Tax=Nocardia sp. 004 TaxID=3385978 RepID=UPI00399EF86A
MTEAKPLLMSMVLDWDLTPARETATALSRIATEIEEEVDLAARAVGDSQPYFDSTAGDSARQRSQGDRKNALITVDIYQEMSGAYARAAAFFEGEIKLIRKLIKEVENSEWDLFYKDNGEVMSRKSNVEWAKKYWWAPGTAIAHKELTEAEFTGGLRGALNLIQEADLTLEATVQSLLEQVPHSAREALIAIPADPDLAKILTDYQTDATNETVLWPSGWLLGAVRAFNPNFEVGSLPREEADALEQLVARHGVYGLIEFYDIKTQAVQAATDQYSWVDQENQRAMLSDGHGDAFRHAYWNALMTQKFGEEWTQNYTIAHEKSGGNPPSREAIDLYNNELGRTIAQKNPDATPEQLQTKIAEAIQNGRAIVLTAPDEHTTPQVTWSNAVQPGQTKIQSGVGVPLPGKR